MKNHLMHDFAKNPASINLSRSTFNRDCRHKTSFNEGMLIPFYLDEVLPGDTFNVRTSALVRLSNPAVRPVMDDMFLDYYYFFVPGRLCWQYFANVHGENDSTYWAPSTEYVIPTAANSGSVQLHSLDDYFGLPVGHVSTGVSLLPAAAYYRVWNEWFRDENYQAPAIMFNQIYTAGNNLTMQDTGVSASNLLGVSRYHDYFSSCLPAPQKELPLLSLLGLPRLFLPLLLGLFLVLSQLMRTAIFPSLILCILRFLIPPALLLLSILSSLMILLRPTLILLPFLMVFLLISMPIFPKLPPQTSIQSVSLFNFKGSLKRTPAAAHGTLKCCRLISGFTIPMPVCNAPSF